MTDLLNTNPKTIADMPGFIQALKVELSHWIEKATDRDHEIKRLEEVRDELSSDVSRLRQLTYEQESKIQELYKQLRLSQGSFATVFDEACKDPHDMYLLNGLKDIPEDIFTAAPKYLNGLAMTLPNPDMILALSRILKNLLYVYNEERKENAEE